MNAKNQHRFVGFMGGILFALAASLYAAQQPVNVGSSANDGTGDTLRTAFTKVNANDTELYSAVALLQSSITGLVPTTRTISTTSPLTGGGSLASNLTLGLGTVGAGIGGTGQDFSASSGLVKFTAGTASVVTAPSGAVVGTTDSQTLTNKTISGSSNTLSNIATSALTGTVGAGIGGTGQDFSASSGLVEFSAGTASMRTAPTGAIVGISDSQTLTNKTINASSNTLTNVSLTTAVTGILPGANGGTNNGFMAFTGPTTSLKTFTLPNATSTILTSNAAVTFGQGGTGLTSASDDTLLLSTGSAWAAAAVPDCTDTGGNHLNYTASTNTISCGTSGGGSTTFANPTASVGLTAVNGVATTAMRSDAAPPIDVSISPTWTGDHTFSSAGHVISAAVSTAGGSTAGIIARSSAPAISWDETDVASNGRRWNARANGMQFVIEAVTNADDTPRAAMVVTRTSGSSAITGVLLSNTTDNAPVTVRGQVVANMGYVSAGTKFTASGCSNGTTVGGSNAGTFVSGTTGTCTVVITLPTATTGWICMSNNRTTPANRITQTASSTTSCTIEGTTVSGDVIGFLSMGY